MSENYVHREPLTSDIIFKAVFGQDTKESKDALIGVLNLVLDRKEDPVVDLTYLNPFSIAEAKSEKAIIMDIKVETSSGKLIDVEMQVGDLKNYINRTIFYGAKQLTKGLASGEDYDKMKKSIVISFIKTNLFPQNVPVHSIFTLHERDMQKELSDILELHYIELGKIHFEENEIDRLDEMNPLEQFGAYLKYSGDPDKAELVETLVKTGSEEISMADKVLRKISEEERLQAIREDRETAEMFIRLEKAAERREGREEMQREIAVNMKKQGIPMKQIIEATGLRENEIITL